MNNDFLYCRKCGAVFATRFLLHDVENHEKICPICGRSGKFQLTFERRAGHAMSTVFMPRFAASKRSEIKW